MKKKLIAVFISGRGSNFKALLDEIERGNIQGTIVTVISDNPGAQGLLHAKKKGIEHTVFEKRRGDERSAYFEKILAYLEKKNVDLIVLAGFMKVLSDNIINRYKNRILNIHPALLPSFPGVHAQKQAVEYGVKYSGCTVHFVDEGVDTGPVVLQEVVPVLDNDTEEFLSQRILEKEHTIYPRAVKLFCEDKLMVQGRRVFIQV
jgi:phosphoribosylglycinamide formyltransferase-1